ncbi:hypothetical protein RJ640_029913 [Escallonia rubra]|uniref:TCP domain-containing protein n=1 Tax=Escallonia rubra TaxID=112253 RepID=A0AA88R649_9ASTE|nr:hypothetical protein RJ640_029913 [Escallonia rubra]
MSVRNILRSALVDLNPDDLNAAPLREVYVPHVASGIKTLLAQCHRANVHRNVKLGQQHGGQEKLGQGGELGRTVEGCPMDYGIHGWWGGVIRCAAVPFWCDGARAEPPQKKLQHRTLLGRSASQASFSIKKWSLISLNIVIFELGDRLGYDRPSKAVDWLINKAKNVIAKLDELPEWNPIAGEPSIALGPEPIELPPSSCGYEFQLPKQMGENPSGSFDEEISEA